MMFVCALNAEIIINTVVVPPTSKNIKRQMAPSENPI